MGKFIRSALVVMMALALMSFVAGCDSGSDDSGSASSDVVGTWPLTSNEGVMVFIFNSDGTTEFQSEAGGTAARGTWSGSASAITGSWTASSGAKDGTIAASIADGVMSLSFIENEPPKTVGYSGSKSN